MITAMAAEDSLGTRIAKRRHQLDLSQEALAGLVGVSRDSVSKWETGKTQPSRHLGKLEVVLKMSLTSDEDPNEREIRELATRLRLGPEVEDAWIKVYENNRRRPPPDGEREREAV
jgi:transcriptional regulator with XRE-family HTH domain